MSDSTTFLSPHFLPLFIDAYRSHPCLWRVKSKEYSNKHLKQSAYQDLVELGKPIVGECNVDYIKKKIELIRGNFRREHKKVKACKKSGSGAESVHVPKLWYYKLLLFLTDQEEVHESTSSMDPPEHNEDLDDTENLLEESDLPDEEGDIIQEQSPVQSENPSEKRKKRSRTNAEDNTATTDCLQQAVSILQRQEDEYEKFAGNVAAKLRKMDAKQCMFAENVINQTLFQGLMGKLQEDSYIYNPQPLVVTPSTSSMGDRSSGRNTPYTNQHEQANEFPSMHTIFGFVNQ
ncbi:uncharacterized protein LOC128984654 [Macrosteles quadrilineatus]|uniref:uncharacterized protein LOC128984654 n=1 Tax=Macrosteles quadrilineatus TaxID=74068 RepID=UPI0023E1D0CE|nr:uncharacterized protein LOC128984654 [Macrosteles quadrilineatus]